MININTYIGKRDLNSYFEKLPNPELFFININNCGSKELLDRMLSNDKAKSIHGVICIQVNNIDVSTFIDWDDLDLMWTALLTMVCDYINDGNYGETQMFTNGLEWSIKRIKSSPENLILFSVLRNYPVFDIMPELPVAESLKASCRESVFLKSVAFSGENYIAFRDEDARTHDLNEAKRLLKELKRALK